MVMKHAHLQGEFRQRVFENKILRRIFGSMRVENGVWRRPNDEEFHSLYFSANIVKVIKYRRLRWAWDVATMEEDRSSLKIITGKTYKKVTFREAYI